MVSFVDIIDRFINEIKLWRIWVGHLNSHRRIECTGQVTMQAAIFDNFYAASNKRAICFGSQKTTNAGP
jgi:hypothetical protein